MSRLSYIFRRVAPQEWFVFQKCLEEEEINIAGPFSSYKMAAMALKKALPQEYKEYVNIFDHELDIN